MFSELLKAFAPYGLPGLLLFLVGFLYHQKDKALQAEQAARVEDAKAARALVAAEQNARIDDAKITLALIMKLQEQVIFAVNKLAELIEIWEKQNDREQLERRGGRRP